MNHKRIKEFEELKGAEIDPELKILLGTSFNGLSYENKGKVLDARMDLVKHQYLSDDEICEYFQFLDKVEKYEDMIFITMMHPNVIGEFFNDSYTYSNYNIQYKWNKSIDNFTYDTKDKLLEILKTMSDDFDKYDKLRVVIIDKILQKYVDYVPEKKVETIEEVKVESNNEETIEEVKIEPNNEETIEEVKVESNNEETIEEVKVESNNEEIVLPKTKRSCRDNHKCC
jgi:hypothetical protein